MKNKIILVLLVIIIFISTGCGNTKKLTCKATSEKEGTVTRSDLIIKVKDNKVTNMSLTLDIKLPKEQQNYKQYMIEQLRAKTNNVYVTSEGVNATFGMNSDYFKTLGITDDIFYGELKDVLEIQGYICENK